MTKLQLMVIFKLLLLAWLVRPAAAPARQPEPAGLIRGVSAAGILDGGAARAYREAQSRRKEKVKEFLYFLPGYFAVLLPILVMLWYGQKWLKRARADILSRRTLEKAIKDKIAGFVKTPGTADSAAFEALWTMCREYLRLKGDPAAFDGGELPYIVKSMPDLDPLARFLDALPGAGRLLLAKKLLDLKEPQKSADILNTAAVGVAGLVDGGHETVVRIYETAGRLDELIDRRCRTVTPESCSAYAEILMRANQYTHALRLLQLSRNPSPSDLPNIFELHIRLGDFSRARALMQDVFRVRPVQREGALGVENRNFYYNMALLCEQKREKELAGGIYRFLQTGLYGDEWKSGAGPTPATAGGKEQEAPRPAAAAPAPEAGAARSPAPVPAPKRDRLDGKYELRSKIGSGGMGIVYEGWDHNLNRKVAIKELRAELKDYPKERERFLREAELVARLTHPYIVGIHAIIRDKDETYLVFDYVAGKTLSHLIDERKQLNLRDCKSILGYVCLAVGFAHGKNIIHRDLKPSNIIVDSNNFAKVMDFGLASELRDNLTKLTRQTVAGTPHYMAPEQYDGIVRPETDIYALGICLYEMLTGDVPFAGLDTRSAKKRKDYRDASLILPWLPGGIDKVISRALEPDPTDRFGDAMSFHAALEKV